MKKYVVIISGPTASGKSDFAIKVARELGGEIINADIGSFYTPLTIGTAKPDFQNQPVAHHLFDILDSPIHFTVVQFRARVQLLVEQIYSRGHVPIIVGGSAFYIKSLFFRQHEIPDTSAWAAKLEQQVERGEADSLTLWQLLHQEDPVRAGQIHPHDAYRIIRALAIFKTMGRKPTEFEQIFDPIAPFYFIICQQSRQELYHRIDARVHEMIKQGWLSEVEKLQATAWEKFLMIKKIIGYDDLLQYLKNQKQADLQTVVSLIQQKTRNYAKRQIIFLNKLQKDLESELQKGRDVGCVQELNLTLCDVGLYIKGLSNRILQTLS